MQRTDSPKLIAGKYRPLKLIGEGAMGEVFEARHIGTGRRDALKVIRSQALLKPDNAVARFHREARAAGAIDSKHIAHVLDAGVDEGSGRPYLVMEFLSGEDLQHMLHRLGHLPVDVALRIVAQACTGLAKAHHAGVIHRDIKPANLFLAREDGEDVIVKLLDFGIAK